MRAPSRHDSPPAAITNIELALSDGTLLVISRQHSVYFAQSRIGRVQLPMPRSDARSLCRLLSRTVTHSAQRVLLNLLSSDLR